MTRHVISGRTAQNGGATLGMTLLIHFTEGPPGPGVSQAFFHTACAVRYMACTLAHGMGGWQQR